MFFEVLLLREGERDNRRDFCHVSFFFGSFWCVVSVGDDDDDNEGVLS